MKYLQYKQVTKFLLAYALICSVFNACSAPVSTPDQTKKEVGKVAENSNQASDETANDDLEALSAIIRIPEIAPDPENVVWKQFENADAKGGQRIVAVFLLTDQDSAKLVELAAKRKPAEEIEIDAEKWFPVELVARSGLSGDQMLRGSVYSGGDFANPPFNNARLIRIENTNFFILELTTY